VILPRSGSSSLTTTNPTTPTTTVATIPSPHVQGTDFDRTSSLLSGTLSRLDGLLRGGGGQTHMCYLIMFVVAVFLALWWFITKR
jgi:hypothetical protein